MDPELIKTLATIILSAGGLAFLKEIISGVVKLKDGKALKEGQRRLDIIAQRDEARQENADLISRAEAEEARADREAGNRRLLEEHISELRRYFIDSGIPMKDLPTKPVLIQEPRS